MQRNQSSCLQTTLVRSSADPMIWKIWTSPSPERTLPDDPSQRHLDLRILFNKRGLDSCSIEVDILVPSGQGQRANARLRLHSKPYGALREASRLQIHCHWPGSASFEIFAHEAVGRQVVEQEGGFIAWKQQGMPTSCSGLAKAERCCMLS